jgi:hypothetical protein
VFLVLKEFLPSFSRGGDMTMDFLAGAPIKDLQDIGQKADAQFTGPKGYEVGYELFGINGKMLGHGEPIRVKAGERVLFHVLNASAGEIRSLALPGHVFRVVSLDGNPVPRQADVPVLWLGTAERISAIVEMNHPGVWVMGDVNDDDREHGMGIVVEHANTKGEAQWKKAKTIQVGLCDLQQDRHHAGFTGRHQGVHSRQAQRRARRFQSVNAQRPGLLNGGLEAGVHGTRRPSLPAEIS